MPDVRLMPRTTVFGVYDGGIYGALERVADHLPVPPPHQPRQRLWRIVAKRAVLAAGAIERSIVFGGNDRPGVMMASAMRDLCQPLRRRARATQVAIFTNNDDGWRTPPTWRAPACAVAAVIDSRPEVRGTSERRQDVRVIAGGEVIATKAGALAARDHGA